MRVGIYNLRGANGESLVYQKYYEEILKYNGIEYDLLEIEQSDFWEKLKSLSLFIMRFSQADSHLQLAHDILPIVEKEYRIPCFPNDVSSWHYDDKVKQYFLLKARGFPIADSWIFYNKVAALDWAKSASYPVVFKLRGGAGSVNVILVKTARQAITIIRRMFGAGFFSEKLWTTGSVRLTHFNLSRELHRIGGGIYRRYKGLDVSPSWQVHKNYVLFQKFLPDNDYDTRITVIGDRAFGFRRFVRKGDFRASGSGMLDYDESKIDLTCVALAFEVSRKMGFQSMAYDFLRNEVGDQEICEISYTYLSGAIYGCPGYWDSDMHWHEGRYLPEYLHLVDALGASDLEMPKMSI